MAEYFTHISEGSGEKAGQLLTTVGASVSGVLVGLAICPYYALCLCAYLPFGSLIMVKLKDAMIETVKAKMMQNAILGAFTEEMLSSLKLIISFGREKMKLEQYRTLAQKSFLSARKSARTAGIMGGSFMVIMVGFSCFSWGIGFAMLKYEVQNPWHDRKIDVADIVGTYQAVMYGMFTVIQVQTLFPAVVRALTVGKQVIDVIERKPLIASPEDPNECVTKVDIQDGIKFENVKFRYPTAPEHVKDVFQGASFKVKAGTSTAIVGPSGSGKSTIVQMINRFYDPDAGEIIYGSTPLKKVDLTTLREIIGWVGQEPVLIVGTIRENLLYGNKDATEQDIDRAIRLANANFIHQMEKGLNTYVGSSTVMNLSGGQKQRIAIARALIKRPQILVLDEATSALDPKSEAEVQNAILNVQKQQAGQLTIIMIAHRLQTIKSADNLLFLESPTSVLGASKGTTEYQELLDRLMSTSYAHQADDAQGGDVAASIESDDDVDDPEKSANITVQEERAQLQRLAAKSKRASSLTPEAKAALKAEQDQKGKIAVKTTFESTNAGWGRLFQYYKPPSVIALMFILAFCAAWAMPIVAYCIIKLQFIYYGHEMNPEWESEARVYLIIQGCWVITCFCIIACEKSLFGIMGEKLTLHLRMMLIEEILHKQISWFDREDRAPGIITNTISSNIASLNGMTSEVLVTLWELACIMLIGMIGGAIFCWQAAILAFLLSPIMIIGMYMMATMQFGNKGGRWKDVNGGSDELDSYAKSNALLSDVVINYRTVISLGQKNVDCINANFEKMLVGPMEDITRQSNKMGLYYGLGTAGRLIYISLMFLIAILVLIDKWGIDSTDVFTSCYLLFFSYMSLGAQASNVPSIRKAKEAARPVFSIIDETSTLDVRKPEHRNIKSVTNGKIEFKSVNFNYPTRAQRVMNEFDVDIPAGSKIALVGHSGCGKSTLINILLRFYNINQGQVLIDGQDLDNYDVLKLREQCGYVMQEPVLFNSDIKTNIRFGKPEATDEEVYIAAQKANAIGFIEGKADNLPEEEKKAKLDEQLKDAFSKISSSSPNLAAMYESYTSKDSFGKQMLVDLLTNSSEELLKSAHSSASEFKECIDHFVGKYGAGWEDIIIRFEWRNELAKIRAGSVPDAVKQSVEQMLQQRSDLYACFDQDSLIKAASSGANDVASLITMITDEARTYRMTVVERRFNELQHMALDKKRVGGKFALHEGFEKDCGLKGGKLSGGQKQRIAIARALIKDPKILILDEATSALDEQSQEVVQQALDRAMEGRTSIVIAHRLSTIRNCDILFVLGNGKIVEQGSYDQLSNDPDSHFNVLKAGMEN